MSQLPDWHRLLIVVYHERVLDSLLDFLLGGFVLWGLYVWQGREKLGVWGFLCWFPLTLGAVVGSALLLHRMTGAVPIPFPPTMYLYFAALLITLLTQPVFKSRLPYVVAYLAIAGAELAAFLWLMWLVIQPLLLQY